MTTEELKTIQDRWADIRFLPSFPASQIEVLNLCAEVERLRKQLEHPHLTGSWLPDLANQCAYQIHRVIGNNIEHYRGQTAKELQPLIRAAIARNTPS